MARPKRPAEITALIGNPGKRAITPGAKAAPLSLADADPLDAISPAARKLWDSLTPSLCALGILTPNDLPALALACEMYSVFVGARAELGEDYAVEGATGGKVSNPAARTMFTAAQVYLQTAKRFGLTPSDRQSLSCPDPEAKDAGEAWFKD